jgi:hypothetical protein
MKAAIASGNFQPSKILQLAVATQHLSQTEKEYWQQDEFSIDGKMYDVVCTKQTSDSLLISCLSDDDETEMVSNFLHGVSGDHSGWPGSKITNLSGLFLPFVLTDGFVLQTNIEAVDISTAFAATVPSISAHAAGVLTPPPRLA